MPSSPRSNFERMLAGEPYVGEGPEFIAADRRVAALTARFSEAYAADPVAAQAVLHELLGEIGEDAFVRAPLLVDYGLRVSIGARTFINFGLTALDVAPITIGADCQIGPHVQLLTPTHPLDPDTRRAKVESAEPITIGDNVWLGGGVTVCPGVTIGSDTVVGAGSVVVDDLPPRVLAVGVPARVIREL